MGKQARLTSSVSAHVTERNVLEKESAGRSVMEDILPDEPDPIQYNSKKCAAETIVEWPTRLHARMEKGGELASSKRKREYAT